MMGEKLNNFSLVFGMIVASAGVIGAWFVLPHRVSTNEAAIKILQQDGKSEKEMLIRMDEKLSIIQKDIEDLKDGHPRGDR
tara:strand:- start:23 stop:265 length:243 start_codon:yes stop_codon:yes gene_type:complete